MLDKRFAYDKIKQIKTEREDQILLVRNKYSPDTGELTGEDEQPFDSSVIEGRIVRLQQEIQDLTDLRSKIENKQFDIIEDKREKDNDGSTKE